VKKRNYVLSIGLIVAIAVNLVGCGESGPDPKEQAAQLAKSQTGDVPHPGKGLPKAMKNGTEGDK